MRRINEIIIHCTATRADWWKSKSSQSKVNEVTNWHIRDRKFSDIGYHFLIDRDGTVIEGRPLERIGAHVRGHNTNTVGVALFGGFGASANDKFEDNFTPEQDTALRDLLFDFKRQHGVNKITGHSVYANKACPGFQVQNWLLGRKPRSLTKSATVQATGAATLATGVSAATAIGALDGNAQIIVVVASIVALLALSWIARERIKKWVNGIH